MYQEMSAFRERIAVLDTEMRQHKEDFSELKFQIQECVEDLRAGSLVFQSIQSNHESQALVIDANTRSIEAMTVAFKTHADLNNRDSVHSIWIIKHTKIWKTLRILSIFTAGVASISATHQGKDVIFKAMAIMLKGIL